MNTQLLEKTFHLSLLIKGLNGLLELIGGTLLLITSSTIIYDFVNRITIQELSEDPTDIIAHAVLTFGTQLGNAKIFSALYLLAHGIVKLTLVIFLLKNNIKAYPWTIATLSIIILYQGYLTWQQYSLGLLILTILDILIIILALWEYRRLKSIKNQFTNLH